MKTHDLEKVIADRIIKQIEQDGLQWIKAWKSLGAACNGITGRAYSGRNVFMTAWRMDELETSDPRFVTRNQMKDAGTFMRKGERGTPIFFFKTYEDGADEKRFVARIYYVWHVSQVADEAALSQHLYEWEEGNAVTFQHEAADRFLGWSDITFNQRGGDKAFYSKEKDEVFMPTMGSFMDNSQGTALEHFYGTLFHEYVHATGAEKRLSRESLIKYAANRPEEELVAELGSAMLCRMFGISPEPRADNAAYIKSWCSSIKDKPAFILSAAAKSSAAVNWLLQQEPQEEAA